MEYFDLTHSSEGFHIEGFPDAVKVIALKGKKAKNLADLVLHKSDLDFAIECLQTLKTIPSSQVGIQRSLLLSAIACFFKCFQESKSRFALQPEDVFAGDTEGLEVFEYFRNLRNKHLLHDENAYHQSLPGAILNKESSDCKIAKIVCLQATAITAIEDEYNNLHLLCTTTRNWVVEQFDLLASELMKELEAQPYAELEKMESPVYRKPTLEDIYIKRPSVT